MRSHLILPADRDGPLLSVAPLGLPSPFPDARLSWCAVRFTTAEFATAAPGQPELLASGSVTASVAASAFRVAVPDQLAEAAPRRIATYVVGRYCADQALRLAGHPAPVPAVGRDAHGAPLWPRGWVGSLSHTDDSCVAVCAQNSVVSYLGVDCERIVSRKIANEIAKSVAPEVVNGSASLGGFDVPTALTLAFSAKEALFKALFPHVGHFFGFEAAQLVRIHPAHVTLELRLVSDLTDQFHAGQVFTLHYILGENVVVTGLALPGLDALADS
jgi:enterobactin synthetase component D